MYTLLFVFSSTNSRNSPWSVGKDEIVAGGTAKDPVMANYREYGFYVEKINKEIRKLEIRCSV